MSKPREQTARDQMSSTGATVGTCTNCGEKFAGNIHVCNPITVVPSAAPVVTEPKKVTSMNIYDKDFPLQIRDIAGKPSMIIHEPGKVDIIAEVQDGPDSGTECAAQLDRGDLWEKLNLAGRRRTARSVQVIR